MCSFLNGFSRQPPSCPLPFFLFCSFFSRTTLAPVPFWVLRERAGWLGERGLGKFAHDTHRITIRKAGRRTARPCNKQRSHCLPPSQSDTTRCRPRCTTLGQRPTRQRALVRSGPGRTDRKANIPTTSTTTTTCKRKTDKGSASCISVLNVS